MKPLLIQRSHGHTGSMLLSELLILQFQKKIFFFSSMKISSKKKFFFFSSMKISSKKNFVVHLCVFINLFIFFDLK